MVQFPIVIKPVDSCGANGVVKCDSLEDFKDLYELSKQLRILLMSIIFGEIGLPQEIVMNLKKMHNYI